MSNALIAQQFDKAADVLAVKNANTFRVLAFRRIARALEELPRDVAHMSAEELEGVQGIGKSSAEKIREFLRTGKIGEFEDLFAEVPHGVMEIMNIPGVGPKTAALLWTEGKITAPSQLLTMIESKSVPEIRGIGEKKLEKIRQNIMHQSTTLGRVRISRALPIAQELVSYIKSIKGVVDAQYCGSLRRGKETIGDIDIAVSASGAVGGAVGAAMTKHPLTTEVIAAGETKTSVRTVDGLQVDVRIVPPESFGAAVQYFTGSKEHNTKLREIAIKKGFKLNEWGLFKGETAVAGKTEDEIYAALGMLTVPPEMREDKGEIQLALERGAKAQKAFDADVLEINDIRSELHMHTTASDGSLSIEEMVAESKRRGFTYCAITDHSKSQFQANGLKTDRMIEHIKAIHAVAKQVKGIKVLAGAEVDILADGSMDYEDELLAQLDWVVGSPHAALTQESAEATARLVRAASHPLVHVIGHPTGRLVTKRRGLEPDMQKVVFAAARSGIAMEVNANAARLDLRDIHVRMAIDAGVPITIDTDAHGIEDFDQLIFGILTAKRGWAMKANVINTWPWEKFEKWRLARREASAF
jgi:DNA polymerase (family 10)